jgi:hypothetical protein
MIDTHMPQSFESASALTRIAEDEHELTIPDGWQQGRGAFGGLVLATLLAAMEADEKDKARLVRAFSGEICAPVLPVATRLKTHLLRRGNNQSNWSATLTQNGEIVAHGSCAMATARKVADSPIGAFDLPAQSPYAEGRAVDLGPPLAPTFTQHYEYRPTGPLPFTGGKDALVLGWVKERVPLSRVTAPALLGRVDAHWPALFSVETQRRAVATVSFLAEFLVDPSTLDPNEPLFYRGRVVAQHGGYFVEYRELWKGDTPVLFNQQSMALLA